MAPFVWATSVFSDLKTFGSLFAKKIKGLLPIGALQCFLKKNLQNFLAMDLRKASFFIIPTLQDGLVWDWAYFLELSSYEKYKKAEQEGQVTASACWQKGMWFTIALGLWLTYPGSSNSTNRGARWATVHGVSKSRTRLRYWVHTHTSKSGPSEGGNQHSTV